MKIALIALASVSVSVPTVAAPSIADAQVLAGRYAARSASRAPRVTREQRLENLLADAEERAMELDERIAELQPQEGETQVALTPSQQRQLAQLTQRREREQREIDRLNAELSED